MEFPSLGTIGTLDAGFKLTAPTPALQVTGGVHGHSAFKPGSLITHQPYPFGSPAPFLSEAGVTCDMFQQGS